ncbi:MAG TPA: hypothetical protein EYP56_03840 [Planctomycetaceae bacterium]|nr:hypothetical protein [Planctomycetaceae bacterium]
MIWLRTAFDAVHTDPGAAAILSPGEPSEAEQLAAAVAQAQTASSPSQDDPQKTKEAATDAVIAELWSQRS